MEREELEREITALEEEIEVAKQQLDEVKAQLGEEPLEEEQAEEQVREEEIPEEGQTEEGTAEEPTEEELALMEKKAQLEEEILVKQMKVVALQKQLNDVISDEASKAYSEEE